MTLDRRSFLRVGALSSAAVLVQARGREAWAEELPKVPAPLRPVTPIRLDSNENPLGPPAEALRAMTDWYGEANRYPDLMYDPLYEAIGRYVGAPKESILLGSGSGEILKVATETFASRANAVVVGGPTFETPERRAKSLEYKLTTVPVDTKLKLDLDAMAAACAGAGLVFLCNPNNPTGTVHGAADMKAAIATMLRAAPQVTILVDEAYHEYVDDPAYASLVPLALEDPRVIVSRTMSKAFGMAGLRMGYAIGNPKTLERMKPHMVGNNVNQLVGKAATVALGLHTHVEQERNRNAQARSWTMAWFSKAGYSVAPSAANFLMVDIGRDAKVFREQCRERGVEVGRPFPPLLTHSRISIGTMEEMQQASEVFRAVLA
jgi:histidinol-phosphate aminotransferase